MKVKNDKILGFNTTIQAENYVARHLGMVEYTVFFRNTSMWYYKNTSSDSLQSGLSYVIFSNNSHTEDSQSKIYNVDIPQLVLQQSIDEAYLDYAYPTEFESYNVSYSTIWQVIPDKASVINVTDGLRPCFYTAYNGAYNLAYIVIWIAIIAMLLQVRI